MKNAGLLVRVSDVHSSNAVHHFLHARHCVGSEPGSVTFTDSPALLLTHPRNLLVQCHHGFRDIDCPSANIADCPQDYFSSCFIPEPARNFCPLDPRQSQKELILGHFSTRLTIWTKAEVPCRSSFLDSCSLLLDRALFLEVP